MKMDAKFYGDVRKAKDDSLVGEDEWICFLVKDNAFAATLPTAIMYLTHHRPCRYTASTINKAR